MDCVRVRVEGEYREDGARVPKSGGKEGRSHNTPTACWDGAQGSRGGVQGGRRGLFMRPVGSQTRQKAASPRRLTLVSKARLVECWRPRPHAAWLRGQQTAPVDPLLPPPLTLRRGKKKKRPDVKTACGGLRSCQAATLPLPLGRQEPITARPKPHRRGTVIASRKQGRVNDTSWFRCV